MTDLQFKLSRLLALIAAPVIVLNWIFMDSKLSLAQSKETEAIISFATKKQHEFVRLMSTDFGEIEIRCLNARQLCAQARPREGARLRVRVQDTSPLGGWWLLSAEMQGTPFVTLESQAAIYREAKVMWGLGTLAITALAFVFWHFAPFGTPRHEA